MGKVTELKTMCESSVVVKDSDKVFKEFEKILKDKKIKAKFTNPTINYDFEVDGKTFELTIHDGWMNVGIDKSEVGSNSKDIAVDRLVDFINSKVK